MADREVYRYVVPIDGEPHVVPLSHDPVGVAAIGGWSVELWAEHTEGAPQVRRTFQVFGTGEPPPGDARCWACARTADGLVWHLYEFGEGQP